jgi:hypothetical protein
LQKDIVTSQVVLDEYATYVDAERPPQKVHLPFVEKNDPILVGFEAVGRQYDPYEGIT